MGPNLSDLDKLEGEERRGQEVDRAENQAKQQASAHKNSKDGTWYMDDGKRGGEDQKTPWHARAHAAGTAMVLRLLPAVCGGGRHREI